jgi:hypothetical protein
MLITTAALRFAVQRCTSSGTSVITATSSASIMNAYQGWLQESGEQDSHRFGFRPRAVLLGGVGRRPVWGFVLPDGLAVPPLPLLAMCGAASGRLRMARACAVAPFGLLGACVRLLLLPCHLHAADGRARGPVRTAAQAPGDVVPPLATRTALWPLFACEPAPHAWSDCGPAGILAHNLTGQDHLDSRFDCGLLHHITVKYRSDPLISPGAYSGGEMRIGDAAGAIVLSPETLCVLLSAFELGSVTEAQGGSFGLLHRKGAQD